jgi:hypothetical protein
MSDFEQHIITTLSEVWCNGFGTALVVVASVMLTWGAVCDLFRFVNAPAPRGAYPWLPASVHVPEDYQPAQLSLPLGYQVFEGRPGAAGCAPAVDLDEECARA